MCIRDRALVHRTTCKICMAAAGLRLSKGEKCRWIYFVRKTPLIRSWQIVQSELNLYSIDWYKNKCCLNDDNSRKIVQFFAHRGKTYLLFLSVSWNSFTFAYNKLKYLTRLQTFTVKPRIETSYKKPHASVSTNYFDPRSASGTRRVCETRLL